LLRRVIRLYVLLRKYLQEDKRIDKLLANYLMESWQEF